MADFCLQVIDCRLSIEMLEDALQKAIEKEEYETASQLRDEIRKRKEKL